MPSSVTVQRIQLALSFDAFHTAYAEVEGISSAHSFEAYSNRECLVVSRRLHVFGAKACHLASIHILLDTFTVKIRE